jgi:Bacterial regulatory protein, Fis family
MPPKKPKKVAPERPAAARPTRTAKGSVSRGPYRKLSMKLGEGEDVPAYFPVRAFTPIRQMNREYAEWTIKMLGGDKPEAARRLGISLRTIYNWFPDAQ